MGGFVADNDDRQRVRDASDIVAVVGEHLALKPKGREYVGLCPFHDDRNPSMCVIPAKQIFHCFVCNTGGDVFTFVQKYHSMGFREALEFLAQRANIDLTPFKPGPGGQTDARSGGVGKKEIIAANDMAAGFFQRILEHPEHGSAARAVIERRGISEEMVERFMIGASPDRWDGLLMTAKQKGPGVEALLGAGLIKAREGGDGHYDALRNRLIFPICDQIGRVIAFGGRKIKEEDEPKYLNSPETVVFRKSTTLYGINHAQRAIKRERTAVVVEGYTDVIACHQAGVEHVVGTLGTALTPGHATVLRRLCDTVVLLFDGDEAGIRAADRAIEVLLSETIDIKIAALAGYTDAKDPDELLKREGGAEMFRRAIDGAVDLIKWKFNRVRDELSGAGPARVAQRIEEEIARFNDFGLNMLPPVRRRLLIRQIAQAADVEERAVIQMMHTGRRSARAPATEEEFASVRDWSPDPRETLLGCLLYDEQLWLLMSGEERELTRTTAFGSELSRVVADALHGSAENGTGTGLHAVLDELASLGDETGKDMVEAEQRATMLRQTVARITEDTAERVTRLFNECVQTVSLLDERLRDESEAHDGVQEDFGQPDCEEPVDEAERLRLFIERERTKRSRYGRSGRNMLSGD